MIPTPSVYLLNQNGTLLNSNRCLLNLKGTLLISNRCLLIPKGTLLIPNRCLLILKATLLFQKSNNRLINLLRAGIKGEMVA